MASPTETSRRGFLAGAAALALALLPGRGDKPRSIPAPGAPDQRRRPAGRLPWIGHY